MFKLGCLWASALRLGFGLWLNGTHDGKFANVGQCCVPHLRVWFTRCENKFLKVSNITKVHVPRLNVRCRSESFISDNFISDDIGVKDHSNITDHEVKS